MTIEEIEKINVSSCVRFSTFARDQVPLVGKKVRIGDILDQEVLVTDYRIFKSKHRADGECLELQIVHNGTVYVLFTGSSVLINEIRSASDKLPFFANITKADRYFSFA